MKKLLTALLVGMLCLTLCACGGKKDVLTAESWKVYLDQQVTEIEFYEDGRGYWSGSGIMGFNWELDGSDVIVDYSYMGKQSTATFLSMAICWLNLRSTALTLP